ncbi:MAG: hypothetical protein EPO40_20780 [Myxococcaceae bacterium]|nr:MAG: hypothetical protein EPO40_20780 [Myxococcaceae bacterium]
MRATLRTTLGLCLAASLSGACASAPRRGTLPPTGVPAAVTAATLDDARRLLDEQPAGDAAYRDLRAQVARLLAARAYEALQSGDTPGAIQRLQSALVRYSPDELARGGLPREFEAPARALLETSSTRGEEGNALGATRILLALESPPADARPTWDRITEWGARNRQDFQRPWVREGELAEIQRDVAAIIPARDVLDSAAAHLIARRQAAVEARGGRSELARLSFDEVRQLRAGLQRSAAELAMVFLRVGELTEAGDRLASLGAGAEGSGLATAIRGIARSEGGADALNDLARQVAPIDHLAAAGVCRVGRQRYAADPRFARCLAAAADRDHDLGLASAHLDAASALRPSDLDSLRDALVETHRWLQTEVGADDVAPGRRAVERARSLLDRWRAASPERPPAIVESDVEELAAQLELAAGNLPEATAHLERATRATPSSREAFLTLSEVAWRHDDGPTALRHLDAGLALPLRPSESDSSFRPRFAVRRAQVLASTGRPDEARARFVEALGALDALARFAEGRELAEAQYERAIVLQALGREGEVRAALDAAFDASADNRSIAGLSVAFCLGHARWSDALDLSRRARAQLTLEPAWQVYFALWSRAAARLAHLTDDAGATSALTAVATTDDPHVPWTTRLAQRAVGQITREQLLAAAHTRGQRAEALFYDAMDALATGDAAGAARDLREVVATETLHYHEYAMAWDTLRRLGEAPAAR